MKAAPHHPAIQPRLIHAPVDESKTLNKDSLHRLPKHEFLRDRYETYSRSLATAVRQVVMLVATLEDEEPIAFHCSGGKDRTGFIATVLLGMMGAPKEVLVQDYLLSLKLWCEALGDDPRDSFYYSDDEVPFIEFSIKDIVRTYGTFRDYILSCVEDPTIFETAINVLNLNKVSSR